MANAENQGLQEMFAAECGLQLDAMRAQLAVLAGGAGSSASSASAFLAAAAALHDSLHTLAGAARAVELLDLEYLLRAFEALAAAHNAQGPEASQLPLFSAAIELAPQLLAPPSGRVRNQMMALVARCASAAAESGKATAMAGAAP